MISPTPKREVVITGMGVVSPIGIGTRAVSAALAEGTSGVRHLDSFYDHPFPVRIGAEVRDFNAAQHGAPRKALKVMSRSIQLGFAAAHMATEQAKLAAGQVDPERLGVVFGADMIQIEPEEVISAFRACIQDGKFDFARWNEHAIGEMSPLWMLKYLPNMPACHVAIALDARGPSNTIVLAEASSLLAVAEGMRVIERGGADVMIVGGTGSRLHPLSWVFRNNKLHSPRSDPPETVSRPFDRGRDGMVYGEGSAAVVLESRQYAEARGAKVLSRIMGFGTAFEPCTPGAAFAGTAIRTSITNSLRTAGLKASDIGHVNAHGQSTLYHDQAEARAIHELLGDVPVTALKSYFGNLGGGTGAVEMVASLLALESRQVPKTLNYDQADPNCPINVVSGQPQAVKQDTALLLNQTSMGQAVAMVVARP